MPVFLKKGGVYRPTVLDTFIDRISITCDVPVKEQYAIVQQLKDVPSKGPIGNYGIGVHLHLGTKFLESDGDKLADTKLLIQCAPKFPDAKFLRVEWNPERITAADIRDALNIVSAGFSLYEHIVAKGTVTRLDVAVDVANLAIDDYVFHRPLIRYTRIECQSGKTLYLGSEDSECATVVYDKPAELKAKNKMQPKHLKKLPEKWSVTRIEQRLRPKTAVTLTQVHTMSNPFKSLLISGYAGLSGTEVMWSMFLDSVRFRTAPAALQRIKNKRLRARYAKQFKKAAVKWWNPDKIWNRLPSQIEKLLAPVE